MTKRNADIFPLICVLTISLYHPTQIVCTVLGVSKMLTVNGCAYISLGPVLLNSLMIPGWNIYSKFNISLLYLNIPFSFHPHFLLLFEIMLK